MTKVDLESFPYENKFRCYWVLGVTRCWVLFGVSVLGVIGCWVLFGVTGVGCYSVLGVILFFGVGCYWVLGVIRCYGCWVLFGVGCYLVFRCWVLFSVLLTPIFGVGCYLGVIRCYLVLFLLNFYFKFIISEIGFKIISLQNGTT